MHDSYVGQLLLPFVGAYHPPSLATTLPVLIESNKPECVASSKVLPPVHICIKSYNLYLYMYSISNTCAHLHNIMQFVYFLYRTVVWDVNNKRMVKCYRGTV